MGALSASAYLTLPEDAATWVLSPLLPLSGFLNIYALPKAGKSHAALQLCEAVANPQRTHWLTFPVALHGPALYYQLDTPRGLWRLNIQKLAGKGLNFDGVSFADRQLLPFPFDIFDERCFETLRADVVALQPVVVVLDTLRELHYRDENDNLAMKQVIDAITQACAPAAVVLVSHAKKQARLSNGSDAATSLMNDARGSSYLPGKMDGILKLSRRRATWQSRAAPETVFPLTSDEGLLQCLSGIESEAAIALSAALEVSDKPNIREIARALHASNPTRSEESFRSLLRRLQTDLTTG